ncbi:MAG: cation:proton antiporter [Candidatus Melainabacteria bacterium]|nr:cation:proton antiporter [Candidatus Melainabacteria bacterium]
MNIISSASHADVLALVIQITVLLLVARVFGELLRRWGQPSVIGEIFAGVVLGPSFLGRLIPCFSGTIIPSTPIQGYLLETISLIGAVLLLLITGFETDLNFIARRGRTAALISLGGICLPFITGFYLGQFLPDDLLTDPNNRHVFALFIATAMSISAIPVIAKVLIDLKLIRRNIGQIIIASGMIDDAVGWTLLSVVVGMVAANGFTWINLFSSVSKVLLFIVLSFTVGFYIVKKSLSFIQDKYNDNDKILSLVLVLTFAWGALAQALHLEVVFGAFAIGIIFGQMQRLPHNVIEKIRSFAMSVFTPIFFAVVGLKMNISALVDTRLFLIALLIIFIASFGKIVGVYMVSRYIAKHDHWTALSYGAALNARGGMEIIVASIGLSIGILTNEVFSMIVLMAIVTSVMAPILLRYTLKHIESDDDEIARLKEEAVTKLSTIKNINRVLMPIRFDPQQTNYNNLIIQIVKFSLLSKIADKNSLSITLLSIVNKDQREEARIMLNDLSKDLKASELVKKVLDREGDIANQILSEAQKDYDMLILGTVNNHKDSESLFSPLMDTLVRLSPTMVTAVVYAKNIAEDWQLKSFLVPTNGSISSRNAAELAYFTAAPEDSVTILNVIARDKNYWGNFIYNKAHNIQAIIARSLVDELVDLGTFYKIKAEGKVKIANDVDAEILKTSTDEKVDLLILGTEIKPASERLFLGPSVERILHEATCPVVIINAHNISA